MTVTIDGKVTLYKVAFNKAAYYDTDSRLMPAKRLSGLQRQVLHFYRSLLREARQKEPEQQELLKKHARREFERFRGVDRKNYQLIEHLLRKGNRQITLLRDSDVHTLRL